MSNSVATSGAVTTMSTDTSANATPFGSNTPTGTVVVPGREHSGTELGRTQWDSETRTNQRPQPQTQTQATPELSSRDSSDNGETWCCGKDSRVRYKQSTPSRGIIIESGTFWYTYSQRCRQIGEVLQMTDRARKG